MAPTYPRFEIEQDSSGNISRVVTLDLFSICHSYADEATDLVEKNILAVSALRREFLQIAVLVYSMFETELLPELAADCKQSVSPLYKKSG